MSSSVEYYLTLWQWYSYWYVRTVSWSW